METISLKALSMRLLGGNLHGNRQETLGFHVGKPEGQAVNPYFRQALQADTPHRVATPPSASTDWLPESRAWLTESGEMRTTGAIEDLAGEIIRLTAGNLPLQATLLRRHVGDYSGVHWDALVEHWQERAAIMEYDGKMDRAEAELEAARLYRAEAFLDELRASG